ncbi:Neuroligin-4, X-linked [Eumeta japonica]|uniref:Neuroligin-4, X-linked n=1 Tax=Eumeta variegata TaxID=151549 RepID=A0A4C1W6T5_EUMVA|nr:Neuroligin-4, X-linked [Eumeta japonica]
MECLQAAWCAALALAALAAAGPRYSSRIVHTDTGAIRGVIVEPASRRLEPVEVFRGVPYAGRPPRLGEPPPPPPWPGTRLADAFAPACPQRLPDVANKSAALTRMPLGLYREVMAAAPALADQSEDCLALNVYVPGSGARGVEAPYAVVVWLGGSSFEWGAGSTLDAAALAARAHLLVVTLNYRLDGRVLSSPQKKCNAGFLTSGESEDPAHAAGGGALLDALAALRWVRRNVAAFGGDPRRVTLAGYAAGAALANTLLMLPDCKGLVSRALLLSGSALSPWALAADAALAREHAAQALRCPRDTPDGEHWLLRCVRARPLAALLAVEAPRARFLAGWAPSVPGAQPATRALHASEAFLESALAVVVTTTESYRYFSEDDIRHGFEEEHRNRVLRTYVRNVYRYHRNEIFAAIRNEYTDWEKPIQHPINIRDATLEALSDAATAAPALRAAQLHARRGSRTYFAHFAHQSREGEYPARLGSVPGEALPYFLALPLAASAVPVLTAGPGTVTGAYNYSRADVAVSEAAVALLAAFAKTGEPTSRHRDSGTGGIGAPAWPRYELGTQQYLSIGGRVRARSHYRGHKLALWLHLVPQLHRPGAAPRHHQFRTHHPDMFAGDIFPELPTTPALADEDGDGDGEERADDADCEPEAAFAAPAAPPAAAAPALPPADSALRPADSLTDLDAQYYSYTVALGVTVGAGCFLLALNVLVFAGIYLQRGRRARPPRTVRGASRPARSPVAETVPNLGRAANGAHSPRPVTASLKRSSELECERAAAADVAPAPAAPAAAAAPPAKKRVQIQEISV